MKSSNSSEQLNDVWQGDFEDLNLLANNNASNRQYLYSQLDVSNILTRVRMSLLNSPKGTLNRGEEFMPNTDGIFITSPQAIEYRGREAALNTLLYIGEDMKRFANKFDKGVELGLVAIPLLSNGHWRVIMIEVDHDKKNFHVHFHDPLGTFNQDLKNYVIETLKVSLADYSSKFLGKNVLSDGDITQSETKVIQQNNGWDCGTISVQNLADYVKGFKNGRDIALTDFIIGSAESNAQLLDNLRLEQIKNLYFMQNDKAMPQSDINSIKSAWAKQQAPEYTKAHTENSTQHAQQTNISEEHSLAKSLISTIFDIISRVNKLLFEHFGKQHADLQDNHQPHIEKLNNKKEEKVAEGGKPSSFVEKIESGKIDKGMGRGKV